MQRKWPKLLTIGGGRANGVKENKKWAVTYDSPLKETRREGGFIDFGEPPHPPNCFLAGCPIRSDWSVMFAGVTHYVALVSSPFFLSVSRHNTRFIVSPEDGLYIRYVSVMITIL